MIGLQTDKDPTGQKSFVCFGDIRVHTEFRPWVSIVFSEFFWSTSPPWRRRPPKCCLNHRANVRGTRVTICVLRLFRRPQPHGTAWLIGRLLELYPESADFSKQRLWQTALSILHHLGRRLNHFKLSAHFLNLRGLLSEAGSQRCDLAFLQGHFGLLFLHGVMLFEKLVE